MAGDSRQISFASILLPWPCLGHRATRHIYSISTHSQHQYMHQGARNGSVYSSKRRYSAPLSVTRWAMMMSDDDDDDDEPVLSAQSASQRVYIISVWSSGIACECYGNELGSIYMLIGEYQKISYSNK